MTFFRQIRRSVRAGELLPIDGRPELPRSLVSGPPRTGARFALFSGALNSCFEPESQQRTYAFLDRHAPGRHSLHVVPNYGHLDMFMGAHAHRDVFPAMLAELER
jgi:hypothetical protein